jgi:GH35 family endo-1,4-beta-xylanase
MNSSIVNPNAVLYVNDSGILDGNDTNRYAKKIHPLLEAGAPVGGIGLQAHFDGPANVDRTRKSLEAQAWLNLPINITGIDSVEPRAVEGPTPAECLDRAALQVLLP